MLFSKHVCTDNLLIPYMNKIYKKKLHYSSNSLIIKDGNKIIYLYHQQGPTVTKLTGPDKAISGDLYLYAESSSPRQPGDKAIFESDVTFPG